jgi:glycolate oxidase iron-sulfur subunit
MSSLRALARLMKELEDQLVVCMRCGLCQAVCPLFAETGREADVARGKLALLDGLLKEILKSPQGVQDHLSRCLLCGSCAANCPSGVKVLDIFIKGRAILAGYLGLSPLKKAIFRNLLAKPGAFNRIMAWGPSSRGFSSSRWTNSWAPPVPALCHRCLRTGISSPWPRSPGIARWGRSIPQPAPQG